MKDILNSHPVSVLKKEISKSNIKGYSKMKKAEIVDLMLKHKDKFSHIKMAEPKKKTQAKKEKKKKPFMTATKASGEVVELKERKPKKKTQPQPKLNEKKLLENMKNLVNKYSKDEIKKQKLTKENLKKYTNPYFDLVDKIEKQLKEVDDPMEFLKKNKELSKKYTDISKNFVRRVKAQLKATKQEKENSS